MKETKLYKHWYSNMWQVLIQKNMQLQLLHNYFKCLKFLAEKKYFFKNCNT